jgi:hypothetical protein
MLAVSASLPNIRSSASPPIINYIWKFLHNGDEYGNGKNREGHHGLDPYIQHGSIDAFNISNELSSFCKN